MQNPYAKYKQQSIMTMTQGDMINLLFDETINRLNKGLAGLEAGDCEATNTHLRRPRLLSAIWHPHWIPSIRFPRDCLLSMSILITRSYRPM